MNIRTMSLPDLEGVLQWARAEGWNPGLSDAAAFHAADPEGFFLIECEGRPAAAISVVNHDANHAFLGLYICLPQFRGQGLGLSLWQEAVRHAAGRSITLDGVPDQQENYCRSGFSAVGKTVRFAGKLPRKEPLASDTPNIDAVIAADRLAAGHERNAFAAAWFAQGPHRTTYQNSDGTGFAVMRACHEGFKIGPFHAQSEEAALALLTHRPMGDNTSALFIDVPESSEHLTRLLTRLGFEPVFETARMVKGMPAMGAAPPYYAVATLELG